MMQGMVLGQLADSVLCRVVFKVRYLVMFSIVQNVIPATESTLVPLCLHPGSFLQKP